MLEPDNRILDKMDRIENDVAEIKTAVTKNTIDLEYHIKRTDDLQLVVENFNQLINPLHEEYIARQAIEKYEKQQKEKLGMTLKVPSFIYSILAILIAAGTIISWFIGQK